MDQLLLKENKAICGDTPRPVYEAVNPRGEKGADGKFISRLPEKQEWKPITAERLKSILEATKKDQKVRRAKVGHADKKNQNMRIYPRAVWQDQVDTFTPKVLDNGSLAGAVDHPGYFEAGTLKNTCIIWRSLDMNKAGEVFADFVIIGDHSSGKDFQAQCEAGLDVGFSTYGYGTGHEPGDGERKEYGLGEDEPAVIMNRDYQLRKIDAVDDPSVADARLCEKATVSPEGFAVAKALAESGKINFGKWDPSKVSESANDYLAVDPAKDPNSKTSLRYPSVYMGEVFAAAIQEAMSQAAAEGDLKVAESAKAIAAIIATKGTGEREMKTLEELKAQYPELFKLHEAAIASAIADWKTKLGVAEAANKVMVESLNVLASSLKAVEGFALPQREVLPAETATRISTLETSLSTEKQATAAANAEKAALQTKIDAAAAEAADRLRCDKAKEALNKALEAESAKPFAAAILKSAEKLFADKAFTAEKAAEFVAGKLEEYKLVNPTGTLPEGQQGAGEDDDDEEDLEPEVKHESEDPMIAGATKKIAEYFGKGKGTKK